ncbi:Rossmann-fold NAD(P)-binding domain-containing protein [Roseococcus pinisoli]|uniref:Uncharacterized protein n=1 Tax=Roseococcus pinisoli TaxID=2835040 RepID=A0ABS5Q7V1_9PROT|nr:hypothetical protein [Roseococcus pinisoli]MBS7809578.1 hypothetical protein [Roseococcus pinisoli]
MSVAWARRAALRQAIMTSPGDRAADAPNPPAHLLLGPDAVQAVGVKLAALQAEIEAWKPVSLATDFD